jgi:hypothetical protein
MNLTCVQTVSTFCRRWRTLLPYAMGTHPMRTLVFAFATVFFAYNGAFAQSRAIPNSQIGKPPIFGGGATARAFQIQNGMIQNGTLRTLDGWIYRPETGTYFNPRTGVTCTAAACF